MSLKTVRCTNDYDFKVDLDEKKDKPFIYHLIFILFGIVIIVIFFIIFAMRINEDED